MSVLIETERLIVKVPTVNDLSNLIKLYMDPDVRSLMYTRAKDSEQIKRWLDASIAHYEKCGFSEGPVYEKASGEFIGCAGLIHLDYNYTNPEIEADCYLLKPYWRKKYGTELLHGFFEWGFNHLSIEKIVATVYPINVNAKHLAEYAGMKYIDTRKYRGAEFLWYEIDRE